MYEINNIKELALFRIDDALFGIDIVHIQEINKNLSFTKIYDAQDYIKGVLNLRGQIVTVVDLRVKFNREAASDDDPNRRMIIVNYQDESVGFLVDGIDDIINIDSSQLEDSVTQMEGVNPDYFSGVYKLDTEIVIILNVEKILDNDDEYTAVA
jgi:purine-binding chemotaxis protein CheW